VKKIVSIIICFGLLSISHAQKLAMGYSPGDTVDFKIINSEKVIANKMIFYPPTHFKKNKAPLFLVNGKEVECISYYNLDDLKNITVLQPNEAVTKYGKKGRNGTIIVTLKDEVKNPMIEILSNIIYFKCKTGKGISDTTKEYFDSIKGKDCEILDLRDTSKMPVIYSNFDNKIRIKNLGVGWDRAAVSIAGATMSGTLGNYIVRVNKNGFITITITTCPYKKSPCNQTISKLKVIELPK
jgi:hypothetical protein